MKSVEKKLKDRVMVDQRMFQRKWEEGDSKAHRRRGTSEVGGKELGQEIRFLVQRQEVAFPPDLYRVLSGERRLFAQREPGGSELRVLRRWEG